MNLTLVAVAIVVVASVIAAVVIPPRIVRRRLGSGSSAMEQLSAETEQRRVVVEFVTIVLAALAFFFTFREITLTQDQLQLDREIQQRERFAAAVEQLGGDNPTVQTAGIYAMEAIATMDAEGYRRVMDETLAAFLRTTAPCDPGRGVACEVRVVGADPAVQTAVTVIGRAPTGPRPLDLRRVNLSALDLSRGNFAGVLFERSNMSQVDVSGADLRGTNMSESIQENLIGQASAITDAGTRWG